MNPRISKSRISKPRIFKTSCLYKVNSPCHLHFLFLVWTVNSLRRFILSTGPAEGKKIWGASALRPWSGWTLSERPPLSNLGNSGGPLAPLAPPVPPALINFTLHEAQTNGLRPEEHLCKQTVFHFFSKAKAKQRRIIYKVAFNQSTFYILLQLMSQTFLCSDNL